MDIVSSRNVGQAFTWSIMGSEAVQAIQDLRWMIALCIVMIIADFRFGMAESKKHYKEAVEKGDATLMKMSEFHFSRAVRRTCNKFVDYMTLLLVFCLMGFAITEPYGICSHVITAGIAVIIAWACEICSIAGHFCYLRGIKVDKSAFSVKNIFLFIGKFIAYLLKKKDADLGEALEETIDNTKKE